MTLLIDLNRIIVLLKYFIIEIKNNLFYVKEHDPLVI